MTRHTRRRIIAGVKSFFLAPLGMACLLVSLSLACHYECEIMWQDGEWLKAVGCLAFAAVGCFFAGVAGEMAVFAATGRVVK